MVSSLQYISLEKRIFIYYEGINTCQITKKTFKERTSLNVFYIPSLFISCIRTVLFRLLLQVNQLLLQSVV